MRNFKNVLLLLSGVAAIGVVSGALAQDVHVESRATASSSSSVSVGGGGIRARAGSSATSSATVVVGTPVEPQRRESTPAALPPPSPSTVIEGPASSTIVAQPLVGQPVVPRPRPPVPCKKTVEVVDDQIRIKVVNNYCAARITNLTAWREGGKTQVQFDVDNSAGGAQAVLRMVEQWTDLRGRVIGGVIDEQRIAIEAKRNKSVALAAPTPAAMIATITLYK